MSNNDFNRINIEDITDLTSYNSFKKSFIERLSEKYRDRVRNQNATSFVFPISDIRKPIRQDGFGLESYGEPLLTNVLRYLQYDTGYIEVDVSTKQFKITEKGIERCKELQPGM